MKDIYDFNENKPYGSFFKSGVTPIVCVFLEKKCKSEEEWDLLVKPYMTD